LLEILQQCISPSLALMVTLIVIALQSVIRAYIPLIIGAVLLALGAMVLLSMRIKGLEKVLRLKAE